ncbi:hypothetical protein [Microbacterium deminutum]|uniref:DUF998 domain-containing protein n=1 Tax=Microbacterium deminutum TaxID=344164 RepID=A0ABN2R174_9MICO
MAEASSIVRVLRHPPVHRESPESAAVAVGFAVFVIVCTIGCVVFWGRDPGIVGPGSVGEYTEIAAAIAATIAFTAGRIALARAARSAAAGDRMDAAHRPGSKLSWFEVAAVALAHGAIALLLWAGLARVLADSFRGAVVFSYAAVPLAGAAIALTAYVVFLSAARLTPRLLSLIWAGLLVAGGFASMLRASDPTWWKADLSVLGMAREASGPTFDLTLIFAGSIVTIIARQITAGPWTTSERDARARLFVRLGLTLIGVLLAFVGLLPVDRFWLPHTSAATGMAVVFGVMVFGLPWLVPSAPRSFLLTGCVFAAAITASAVLFATRHYNLTAVELVSAVLIVSWIVMLSKVMVLLPPSPATPVGASDVGTATENGAVLA